jgi:chloramphenicol O-acetyltransferase type A
LRISSKRPRQNRRVRRIISFFKDVEGRDDLIYITSVQWVSFPHMSQTISLNKDDSVPRLAWGKYFVQGDKILLPFSVQAHHSFVDGIHVGRYIDCLQDYLDEYR